MQIITNQFQKELKQHGSEHFPFLVSYQRLSEYESGAFLWHWHPEIEITYVQQGFMCYKVNDQIHHLKAGDIIFNNSKALHSGTMEEGLPDNSRIPGTSKDCFYIPITFDLRLIYGFYQSTINTKYVEPLIQNTLLPAICIDQSEPWHKEFRERFLQIISLDKKKPDFYELDITIHLQTMWKLLLSHIPYEASISPQKDLEYERIRKILSYIEENYMNRITLHDIAGHIHLCESECTRLFKRQMNTTLFSFLQEYRIERSLEYLNSQNTISYAAEKVGFTDSNYYSKVFMKLKGCSPREYKKKS